LLQVFSVESRMKTCIKRARSYLSLATVGLFLVVLWSRAELFSWGHKNVAMLAISRWASLPAHCSDVAVDDLRLAEMHLVAAGEGSATRNARLLDRVRHFQLLCEQNPPLEAVCDFPFEARSLPCNELEQTLPGFPAWTLRAYWVDEATVELGEQVQVVLKWTIADTEAFTVPERQVKKVHGVSGTEWCFWHEGNAIVQAGKVRNLVPNGGFELNFLPDEALPCGCSAGSHSDVITDFFYHDISNRGDLPTTIACLKAQAAFHAGLYVLIPVAEFEPGSLFLQGADVRTMRGATASVGGIWETPKQRIRGWAVRRVETGERWISYARVVTQPETAYRLSFRVANWGDSGTACFDDVFVLTIDHPSELLEALW